MSTKRARRRKQRTQEMIDEAMAIVLEGGLEKLTIARLAHRLDAAVGAIYRYFPSKDVLMVALQKQAISAFHRDLEKRLGQSPTHRNTKIRALKRLVYACRCYLEDATTEPIRHRLIDAFLSSPEALLEDDDAKEINASTISPIVELFVQRFDAAVEAGALEAGDNEQRTYVLWAGLHGLDHFRKRDRILPSKLQVKALTQATLTGLLAGWGAEDKHIAKAF